MQNEKSAQSNDGQWLTHRQLAAIFEPGELVGFKPNAYTLDWTYTDRTQYFVLNPLKDRAGGALLDNIGAFRNILVEFDSKSLKKQEDYIERELEMPYTTKIWSGGKSYHYIISLSDPMPGLSEYRLLVHLIYSVVRHMDTAVRNANRLTRLGDAIREDNGQRQRIYEIRERVSSSDLKDWLFRRNSHITQRALIPEINKDTLKDENEDKTPYPATLRLIEEGILQKKTKSRHQAILFAALDLKRCGWPEERIRSVLEETADRLGLSGRGDVDGIIRWTFKQN